MRPAQLYKKFKGLEREKKKKKFKANLGNLVETMS